MKLISSRQAWHDAFYLAADSTLEGARQTLELGITPASGYGLSGGWKKTKAGSGNNGAYRDLTGVLMHRAVAGRIQSAISYLPEVYRRFGMVMYAPPSFIVVEDVEVVRDWLASRIAAHFVDIEKPLSNKNFELLPLFIQAMLMRHRELVANRPDPFQKNAKLRRFMFDEYGVKIPPENFWRNYGALIEQIQKQIDRLDQQCLVPVAKVIKQSEDNWEIQHDEERPWMKLAIGHYWDKCFRSIRSYCEGLA